MSLILACLAPSVGIVYSDMYITFNDNIDHVALMNVWKINKKNGDIFILVFSIRDEKMWYEFWRRLMAGTSFFFSLN